MNPEPAAAMRYSRPLLATFGLGLLLAAAGCSGKNLKPGSSLADAETAVARAERARIGDYDPVSWKAARDNLALARASSGSKEADVEARWFAARARADAELGLVRAERARLAALTAALKREIAALVPESAPAAAPEVTP